MNHQPVLLEYLILQFFLTYTKESIIDLYGIEIFILQKHFILQNLNILRFHRISQTI